MSGRTFDPGATINWTCNRPLGKRWEASSSYWETNRRLCALADSGGHAQPLSCEPRRYTTLHHLQREQFKTCNADEGEAGLNVGRDLSPGETNKWRR